MSFSEAPSRSLDSHSIISHFPTYTDFPQHVTGTTEHMMTNKQNNFPTGDKSQVGPITLLQ